MESTEELAMSVLEVGAGFQSQPIELVLSVSHQSLYDEVEDVTLDDVVSSPQFHSQLLLLLASEDVAVVSSDGIDSRLAVFSWLQELEVTDELE